MTKVLIRPKAVSDLDYIWDYTVDTWGHEQAIIYLHSMNRAFLAIAQSPHIGRSCAFIKEGLFVYPCEKHRIFYGKTAKGIDIIRILHERMDIPHRFSE